MTTTAGKPRATGRRRQRGPTSGGNGANGDTATERLVIDAAVSCILECGFYRASTNEIARRAGVTWGVIQHYFGTREGLMLAVLQDGIRHFVEVVEDTHVEGDTAAERIEHLIDILLTHYGRPEYLAYMQILLNMDRDPRTSDEVRETMQEVAARSQAHMRNLLQEGLGAATGTPDLATTVFLVIRGLAISQHVQGSMAYDFMAPTVDRSSRQRRLLAEMLAPYLDRDMKTRKA
ncbi:MAG TPA: TetR/AcrR family transcriptional regulator [Acidimicrobiales bacterium]|nr:TetR/AcrR family transcriptional regulator [Acidimicrobiales bacterium]